jgi:hypothetical protein
MSRPRKPKDFWDDAEATLTEQRGRESFSESLGGDEKVSGR